MSVAEARRGARSAGCFGTPRPAYAWASATKTTQPAQLSGKVINLTVAETLFRIGDRTATAHTINGTVPGPLLRLREGDEITLNVTNRLNEIASIHWHGIFLPPDMDGVPGVSFGGIKPGMTFTYRFPLKQSGTYWYHSHSGFQEQLGVYGPMIIDPIEPDPVKYDRDYVVILSDWTFEEPMKMMGKLKKQAGYFNFQRGGRCASSSPTRRKTAGGRHSTTIGCGRRCGWTRPISPTSPATPTPT